MPENPYAAPQVIDPAVTLVPELAEELVPSLESIRTGAQLSLKATWLVFLACVVVGVSAAIGGHDFVSLMLWILLGAAAFCFLLGLVAFGQVTTAAGIRRLMLVAIGAFVVSVLLAFVEGWVLPAFDGASRLAWNALTHVVSMTYLVAFLWSLARLGQVLHDSIVTRWATVAAWTWGAFYTIVAGMLLVGALSENLREKILRLDAAEHRTTLIIFVGVLGIMPLVGLFGFLRALWRLKKIEAA